MLLASKKFGITQKLSTHFSRQSVSQSKWPPRKRTPYITSQQMKLCVKVAYPGRQGRQRLEE